MLLRNVGTFHSTRLNIPKECSPQHFVFSDAGFAVCLKREFIVSTCAGLIRDQKTSVGTLLRLCSNELLLSQIQFRCVVEINYVVAYVRLTATKGLKGSRGIALLILNLGARRGWLLSTTLYHRPLYPRERPTHCTGVWVGPRAGLDVSEKSRLHRDSIPGPSNP
jgi:hypothetical protein